MKLIEALQIANAAPQGPPFHALLACGFTPLHLETAVKAHLRLSLPARSIVVRTGLYGDLAGTLERQRERLDAALVVLEWGDLDPRLAWRSAGKVNGDVVSDARARLKRIETGIATLAEKTRVGLSLPALPLPPVFHTPGSELNRLESALWELLYGLAASTRAVVLHTETLCQGSRHDLRTELMNGFPYQFAHADALAAGFVGMIVPVPPKKGLITDLDGTLWSGVLGDDGPNGISWDVEHKTQFHGLYQHLLNLLAEAGILLGVASKNDAGRVHQALARPDLVVNPQRLFPIEAHWRPKPESVERILESWNVGADSVVFVDDSRLELEQVRTAFPAIECQEFRRDDASFLVKLRDRFGKREVREEDALRVASIRGAQKMRRTVADGESLETLLAGAEARVRFRWGKEPPDGRALELVNKTNQFNLNGIRYSEADWNVFLSDPTTHLLVVEYEDRFGKLGKIAVLGGRERDGGFELEIWVMSCRAFSRRIEHQCLKMLLSRWDPVRFQWKRGERNGPMLDFLTEMTPDWQAVRQAEFSRRCPPLFHETECTGA
jgi:FkbH-like protein